MALLPQDSVKENTTSGHEHLSKQVLIQPTLDQPTQRDQVRLDTKDDTNVVNPGLILERVQKNAADATIIERVPDSPKMEARLKDITILDPAAPTGPEKGKLAKFRLVSWTDETGSEKRGKILMTEACVPVGVIPADAIIIAGGGGGAFWI